MATKNALILLLIKMGAELKFDVKTEVEASESAWVDIVWFDKRLPISALPPGQPKMRYAPVLPVVAFEVEVRTGLNAKHVKGSVSNLINLGAQLGVIVIGQDNLNALKNQTAHRNKTDVEIGHMLRDRVYRWVYAEAQPKGRIIIMFENEVSKWSQGITAQLSKSKNAETEILPE